MCIPRTGGGGRLLGSGTRPPPLGAFGPLLLGGGSRVLLGGGGSRVLLGGGSRVLLGGGVGYYLGGGSGTTGGGSGTTGGGGRVLLGGGGRVGYYWGGGVGDKSEETSPPLSLGHCGIIVALDSSEPFIPRGYLEYPLLPNPLAAGCRSKNHRYSSNFFLRSWEWANECSVRPLQQCAHLRPPFLHDPWRMHWYALLGHPSPMHSSPALTNPHTTACLL